MSTVAALFANCVNSRIISVCQPRAERKMKDPGRITVKSALKKAAARKDAELNRQERDSAGDVANAMNVPAESR
jgi:hypothetical protein